MLNVTLLTSIAKNALVGAVATKLVDTFISNKINCSISDNVSSCFTIMFPLLQTSFKSVKL